MRALRVLASKVARSVPPAEDAGSSAADLSLPRSQTTAPSGNDTPSARPLTPHGEHEEALTAPPSGLHPPEPEQTLQDNRGIGALPPAAVDHDAAAVAPDAAREGDAAVALQPMHDVVESSVHSPQEDISPSARAADTGAASDPVLSLDLKRSPEAQSVGQPQMTAQDAAAAIEHQFEDSSLTALQLPSGQASAVKAAVASAQTQLSGVEPDDVAEQEKEELTARSGDGKRERAGARASSPAKDTPKPPRPSPESFIHPFDDTGLQPPSNDYLRWNKALAEYCLLGSNADNEDNFLSITPRILSGALAQVTGMTLSPEDAEASFADAVSNIYRTRVLTHPRKLAVLRRCDADGLPECVAFLALSVLAAYRMQTDEEAGASAYYVRLEELLRCGLSGGLPRAFEYDEFEGLWFFMHAWLEREHGRRLAMPKPDVGVRRYVALPLTHVPLRRVDIERLPDFFDSAGYEPGARIIRAKLDEDLTRWSRGRAVFTNAGMAALADERRGAVLAQIAHELESWDGAHTDPLGRRSSRVEILLDIVQRRPQLSYLPRRPAAFPNVFDDGTHAFEASEEGWYDPLPMQPDDGPTLRAGFSWEIAPGRLRLALRRPAATVIGLPASNEYTGFLSHRGLRLGAMAAALCCDELAEEACEYLSSIAQQRCTPLRHPSLPQGWQLFSGIKVQRRIAPPAGLEGLAVEDIVNLVPSGGLRLGGRWAWLAGAPPRLTVTGIEAGQAVTIDGQSVPISDDGSLAADVYLSQPGVHVVETSGLRRRVEVVEPEFSADVETTPTGSNGAIALPPGSWCLLGAAPGEVAAPAFQSAAGSLAICPFPAVWAIESAGRRGAIVLSLSLTPPRYGRNVQLPAHGLAARSVSMWASTIYEALIRRPRLDSLGQEENGSEVANVWNQYAQAARDIKRRMRRPRR